MPDGGANLPGWPLLMDASMSALFVQTSRRDFLAGVQAGVYPPGRVIPPNTAPRWHRFELEAVMARLYGLDALAPAQQDAAAHEAARDALRDFTPTPARRAPAARPGRP